MNFPNLNLKTDHQIQQLAFQVLVKELGIVGFIQFIQSFDQGSGDYTQDRQQWQNDYTVDSITQAILQNSHATNGK
jgi:hypothetical protein